MLALADYLAVLIAELAAVSELTYQPDGHDDAATLETLVELGSLIGPITSRPDQVMALIGKLEEQLASRRPIDPADRGSLSALLMALEEALA